MSCAALDCKEWVEEPSQGKGSAGVVINTAFNAFNDGLKRKDQIPYWRFKAAYYEKAGSWGVGAYLEMRDAYDRWKAKQEANRYEALSQDARDAIAALSSLREQLAQTDPGLHQEQIAALDYTIWELSGGHSRLTPPPSQREG